MDPRTPQRVVTASSTATQSTAFTDLSLSRVDTNESSLLNHLQLDEEEDKIWRSTPPKLIKQHMRKHTPVSVPAACFPSLRGKIPSTPSTPSTPSSPFLQDKIQNIERSNFREESQPRYSVYVSDQDFEIPKSKWYDQFKPSHTRSISAVFMKRPVMQTSNHKPSKSFSTIE